MNTFVQNIITQQINPPHQRILIAPLNWGLGHAVRCMPIIQSCLDLGHDVVIASDGLALDYLKNEFPQLECYLLTSYDIKYSTQSMVFNLIMQSPKIWRAIIQEEKETQKIIEVTKSTTIISDNRMGVYQKGVLNIYMTHQYHILHRLRWIGYIASKLHQSLFKRFDKVWIPDFGDDNAVAPHLSSTSDGRVSYLGILTTINVETLPKIHNVVIILSGPEPQRSILENAINNTLGNWSDISIVMVRGSNSYIDLGTFPANMKVVNMANRTEIATLLNSTNILVARSGYTTIMDVEALDIEIIWIPTPGQTEQEYLAKKLNKRPKNHFLEQKNINTLQKIIRSLLK